MGKLFEKMFEPFSDTIFVRIYDRNNFHPQDQFVDFESVCDADLIIPCVPIPDFESVIKKMVPHLHAGQTILHICSLQTYPKEILRKHVPPSVHLIGSHPMFGPQTLAACENSFEGLNFVVDPIFCSDSIFNEVTDFLRKLQFNVIQMNAEEHDARAAKFHFISHVVANILTKLELEHTPIDTKSYEFLFNFLDRIDPDPVLMQSMLQHNPFARIELERFNESFADIKDILSQFKS